MIPEDWTLEEANGLCSQISVGIVVRPAQYYVEEGSGVRTFRSANVGEGFVKDRDWIYISAEGHRLNQKSALKSGDVLVVRTGYPGTACVVSDEFSGSNCIDIIFARPINDRITSGFLCLFTNSEYGKKQVLDGQGGMAQQHFNVGAFKELLIPLPPLIEQRRIARFLDGWDVAIETREKLVAAKQRRLDWIRLRVLTGASRLSGHTKPWKTSALAEVLTEHGEASTGKEEVYSVSVHLGLVNQIEHLGRSFAADSTAHYNRVNPGDIVYTKSPTGQFPLGIIKQSKVDKAVIVSPLYGVFAPATRALGTVVDALLASPSAAARLLAPVVQKGAKNTIAVTNRNFLQAKLFLPTDEKEIEALCDLVEAAQAELKVHRDELNLLRREKRGLMQKLLTGDWRVPEGVDRLIPNSDVAVKLAKEVRA